MTVNIKKRGVATLVITGMDGPKQPWRTALFQGARTIQLRIAELFESARAATGPLGANKDETTVRKILDGLDPRRGHMSGRLQSALYAIRTWTVSPVSNEGTATISFSDSALLKRIDYSKYLQ